MQGGPQKLAQFLHAVTLTNINQFSKFAKFFCHAAYAH